MEIIEPKTYDELKKYYDSQNIASTFTGHPLLENNKKDNMLNSKISVPCFINMLNEYF